MKKGLRHLKLFLAARLCCFLKVLLMKKGLRLLVLDVEALEERLLKAPLMKKGLRHRLLVVQDLALSFESSPDEEGVETPEG